MGMTKNNAWKRAIEHILGNPKPANDNQGCQAAGLHQGPNVTVGADGKDTIRLCLHHAKVWADSDLCHDFAMTGHTDSVRVLSRWICANNRQVSV
jgi:hypothetical protein